MKIHFDEFELRDNATNAKSFQLELENGPASFLIDPLLLNSQLYQLANCRVGFKLPVVQVVKSCECPVPSPIQQRNVTRVVKGAVAGGFRITSVKVDKHGSIVLYSNFLEREECEEPGLPIKSNEWDEVFKK